MRHALQVPSLTRRLRPSVDWPGQSLAGS